MLKKSKIVFKTQYFNVEEEENVDGSLSPFYRINSPEAVVVVAKTSDNKFILIRQFRQAVNQDMLEFSAGAVDGKESLENAARREFLEETGYECKKMLYVGSGKEFSSRLNVEVHVFYAEDAQKKEGYKKEDCIEVVLMSPKKLTKLVEIGDLDNFSLLGVLLFAQYKIKHKNILDIF